MIESLDERASQDGCGAEVNEQTTADLTAAERVMRSDEK
jgi:hypothetical protein